MPRKIVNIDYEILNLLNQQDSISFLELSQKFNYSLPIIRRICNNLIQHHNLICERGKIKISDLRTYKINTSLQERSAEKKAIAQKACQFIKEGDTIFIGAGSTTSYMCRYLNIFNELTVITNSIPILNELMFMPKITTIVVGGILQSQDSAVVGEFSDIFTRNFNASKIFLGTEGIDIKKGASRSVIQKNMTENTISQLEGEKFILTDHSKFGKIKTWVWLPIENIDTIITDSNLSNVYKKEFSKTHISLVITGVLL